MRDCGVQPFVEVVLLRVACLLGVAQREVLYEEACGVGVVPADCTADAVA